MHSNTRNASPCFFFIAASQVWALTVTNTEDKLVSGGGDSVINVWKDVTVEVEEKKAAEQEEQILLYVWWS